MFFLSRAALGPPGLPQNIAFYYENLDFKARIWVREEERKKEEERRTRRQKQVLLHNRTRRTFLLFACVETPHSDTQMKDIRTFEEVIAGQTGDRLKDQTRLSILNWNAGLRRGKVTRGVMGPHLVVRLQEAESHLDEITKIATEISFSPRRHRA